MRSQNLILATFLVSIMKYLFILFFAFISSISKAQGTYEIEPSRMEVKYVVSYLGDYHNKTLGKTSNLCALRCGSTTSQFFCYERVREDSLEFVPGGFELLSKERHDDEIEQTYTPFRGEFIYRNNTNGVYTVYGRCMGEHYEFKDSVCMNWTIDQDSTRMILGYKCQKAETDFRGRHWVVWFAADIPLCLGPWKIAGLPGLVLRAECLGFLEIEANGIFTKGLTPVKFYNYYEKKFTIINRKKFLKIKTNPLSYPKGAMMIPQMELE